MAEKIAAAQTPFEQAIRIAYRPSRRLFIMLVGLHILALGSIMLAEVFIWARLLLLALVLGGLLRSCKDYLEQSAAYPHRELLLDSKAGWYLIEGRQTTTELQLRPAALVHPLLIALRFTDANRNSYSFVLTADNVDQDSLRRLRVRLCFADGDKEA